MYADDAPAAAGGTALAAARPRACPLRRAAAAPGTGDDGPVPGEAAAHRGRLRPAGSARDPRLAEGEGPHAARGVGRAPFGGRTGPRSFPAAGRGGAGGKIVERTFGVKDADGPGPISCVLAAEGLPHLERSLAAKETGARRIHGVPWRPRIHGVPWRPRIHGVPWRPRIHGVPWRPRIHGVPWRPPIHSSTAPGGGG